MASTNVMMHQKVKILCTMGPAIASAAKVTALVQSGANAFRLNMSHGSHESHTDYIKAIRATERKLGIYLPIIADLQGPKIRVADFKDRDAISLVAGHNVFVADVSVLKSLKLQTTDEIIPVTYPTIAKDVKKGDVLLFDDGLLKVAVVDTDGKVVRGMVVHGGALKPRKGLNLPHTAVSQPAQVLSAAKKYLVGTNFAEFVLKPESERGKDPADTPAPSTKSAAPKPAKNK